MKCDLFTEQLSDSSTPLHGGTKHSQSINIFVLCAFRFVVEATVIIQLVVALQGNVHSTFCLQLQMYCFAACSGTTLTHYKLLKMCSIFNAVFAL